MNEPVVLCAYKRSPFTFANKGGFAGVRPDDIVAAVINALVEQSKVNPDDIEDLLMGCAFPEAEQGFNLAKIVGQLCGLPVSVAGGDGQPVLWLINDCNPYGGRGDPDGGGRGFYLCRGGIDDAHSDGRL